MLLIRGTMSAISAGMLIYASTVEMIGGDFVFGDVDGGHGHGHRQPHPDPRFDNHDNHQPHMPGQSRGDCDNAKQHQEEQSRMEVTTMTKKVLAVLSLFSGAAGMVLVGLGE
jgi:solute carrier family 39 (zinc transporter), member 1/2/3